MRDVRFLNSLYFITHILNITTGRTAFITSHAASCLFCNFIYYALDPDPQ